MTLQEIYNELLHGNISVISDDVAVTISNIAMSLLSQSEFSKDDIDTADLIIRIGNITYNNTSIELLPLDDGLYDQLLIRYKKYNPNYEVGAPTVQFDEVKPEAEFNQKLVCTYFDPDNNIPDSLFAWHLYNMQAKDPRYTTVCVDISREPISKRLINTEHKYPELVGTLDKCKFVLNADAGELVNQQSIAIFERDFIHQCLSNGAITPNEEFDMVCEFKYDGCSIEAEVLGDTIITALSRGDTANNVATDYTPIFGGYRFPNAKDVPKDIKFGIKFECIITKTDLEKLGELRGIKYKNCRNAISGLLSSRDAYNYLDYITLVPLATSLDIDRISELEFLNKYYNSGEYNRYSLIHGNYQQILYQVKNFFMTAEYMRDTAINYLIDGIVVSFIDPKKKAYLGRSNSVNKWSMAIKFIPKKVRTIFLGYTFSVGRTGVVIPNAHFKPCEFLGNVQKEQTVHSYARFMELGLIPGQEIDIEYRNEVISYITAPDTERNIKLRNTSKPIPFPETCPYCGHKIIMSSSGKSAYCSNPDCHERNIQRMVYMMDIFGFEGFSEETIRRINLDSAEKIFTIDDAIIDSLGPLTAISFRQHRDDLIKNPIHDYSLASALGLVDGMADTTWKLVLRNFTLEEIINCDNASWLTDELMKIKGIGQKTAMQIAGYSMDVAHINLLDYDVALLNVLLHKLNVINTKDSLLPVGPRVTVSGTRDPAVFQTIVDLGYDCAENYGCTKDTKYLIVMDKTVESSKVKNAHKYGIPIYTLDEFLAKCKK